MTNNTATTAHTATYLIERIDTTSDNSRYDAFHNGRGTFIAVVGEDDVQDIRNTIHTQIQREGSSDLIRVTQI